MNSLRIDTAKVSRRPVGIDLFSGAGGLSLGFEQAGFDVAAAVEIDPIHCAVHEFNFPHCAILCADASNLRGRDIRQAANLDDAPIDVVFGGAPCQGFSLIGKRALDDPRNRLPLEFLRLTLDLDANYFVFENVKGLTIGHSRQLLEELVAAFEESGYNVLLPYRVLNAADLGVPQDRRRLFLIGAKKGMPLPTYPPNATSRTTVLEAIGDLPDPDDYPVLIESDSVQGARFGKASNYARVLRGLADEPRDFSYRRKWDCSRLTSSLRTEHTQLSQRRFAETPPGKVEAVSRFLKLDPNGLCNTLRAGTGSDKGAFTSPRPIHPTAPRCITVREAARLHSYPDWFRFHSTKWHGFRQIGNSVPPLMARSVAAQLIGALGLVPARPNDPIDLGMESLLSMTMTDAARRYGVRGDVAGRRLRRENEGASSQLKLAMA
jgi:DNA (cytosine-5)-methyltransferase 1